MCCPLSDPMDSTLAVHGKFYGSKRVHIFYLILGKKAETPDTLMEPGRKE
jgi:hypothetical protein